MTKYKYLEYVLKDLMEYFSWDSSKAYIGDFEISQEAAQELAQYIKYLEDEVNRIKKKSKTSDPIWDERNDFD